MDVFEFEPVQQQNGVSLVSPVARQGFMQKRNSMFVPRVVNGRIKLAASKGGKNKTMSKIKRGSNVSPINAKKEEFNQQPL